MARSLDYKRILHLLLEEGTPSVARRRFLKQAAVGAASTAVLSACGSFDRWVLGDSNHLEEEVMILGAGLAGLAAAYQLKKNKIPYRVYEASSRAGGRIQTLTHFNSDDQFAEMGAEFFDGSHTLMHQLCKELNVPVEEISYSNKNDRALYWLDKKVVTEKEFRRRLRPLALKLSQSRQDLFVGQTDEVSVQNLLANPKAAAVDAQSLADLLNPLKSTMDGATLECFENLCLSEWGVETKQINLLQYLVRMEFEEKNISTSTSKIYRVEGGLGRVTQFMAERVQGIMPGMTLKLENQLVAIHAKNGGFECSFKTPHGSDTVWARQIICTLPWSVLKDVDGAHSLAIGISGQEVLRQATYGTHTKSVASFKETFWRKRQKNLPTTQGVLRGQLLGQVYWDSSRQQKGTHGLLASQRGGLRGQNAGVETESDLQKDLKLFYKDVPANENFQLTNWSTKVFAKGSRYVPAPAVYLKYLDFLANENEKFRFYMAGEHMSFRDFGTMQGALATAAAAANKAAKYVFDNNFIPK